jgi:hypothetical protein
MKKVIIILISMITNVFYAQSNDEIQSFDSINKEILNTIPSLVGKEYFAFNAIQGNVLVISKVSNNYTYYNIEIGRTEATGNKIINTKILSYNPVFDKIFTTFVPKAGAKRYLSDYGPVTYTDSFGAFDFLIYKNGVRTFDTSALPKLATDKVSPVDEEILNFIYNVIVNIDKFVSYTNTIKTGTFKRNNCGAGQTGSSVLYTVPAGKYNSTISQADADAQAQADVNANGQNNANNQGTCKKGVVKEVEPEE